MRMVALQSLIYKHVLIFCVVTVVTKSVGSPSKKCFFFLFFNYGLIYSFASLLESLLLVNQDITQTL